VPDADRLYLDSWEISAEGGAVRLEVVREDGVKLVLHIDVPIAHTLSEKLLGAAARAQLARQGGTDAESREHG